MTTPCRRCRAASVVSYNNEMLCGICFLATSRELESLIGPKPGELPPRAVTLMNELIDLLRTSGAPVPTDAELMSLVLQNERPS
jgi:hypothetical protein